MMEHVSTRTTLVMTTSSPPSTQTRARVDTTGVATTVAHCIGEDGASPEAEPRAYSLPSYK